MIHTLYCPQCERYHETVTVVNLSRRQFLKLIKEQVWAAGYFYFSERVDQGATLLWPRDAQEEYHNNRCVNEKHPMIIMAKEKPLKGDI